MDTIWEDDEFADVAVPKRASHILDGWPLWHVVVEDMLRAKHVITAYFVIQDVTAMILETLQERIYDFLGVELSDDFTGDDLEQELLAAEPLFETLYKQAKPDGKWKGQYAYHTYSRANKVMLNLLSRRTDLVGVLLKFTHEGEYGSARPWLVLADLAFGTQVLDAAGVPVRNASAQADTYGNTIFHLLHSGSVRTLREVLLPHIESLKIANPVRFRALLGVLAKATNNLDRAGLPGKTVLERAVENNSWETYDLVKAFLLKHASASSFSDPLADGADPHWGNATASWDREKGEETLITDVHCGDQKGEFCTLSSPGMKTIVVKTEAGTEPKNAKQFLVAFEVAMQKVDAAVSATKNLDKDSMVLKIKGFNVADTTVVEEAMGLRGSIRGSNFTFDFLEPFVHWILTFRSAVFSNSFLGVACMKHFLLRLNKAIYKVAGDCRCHRLGLGFRPATPTEMCLKNSEERLPVQDLYIFLDNIAELST